MFTKRSSLFLTQVVLLFFVSQLFWPVSDFVSIPLLLTIRDICYLVIGVLFFLFVPGRRWTHIFFDEMQIGKRERYMMSGAVSLLLIVFSAAYLQLLGVTLDARLMVTIASAWIFLGVRGVLLTKKTAQHTSIPPTQPASRENTL